MNYYDTLLARSINGGGGGGSKYTENILYTNETSAQETVINLSDNISSYDQVILCVDRYADGMIYKIQYRYNTTMININDILSLLGWAGSGEYLTIKVTADNELELIDSGSGLVITDVVGVNY